MRKKTKETLVIILATAVVMSVTVYSIVSDDILKDVVIALISSDKTRHRYCQG